MSRIPDIGRPEGGASLMVAWQLAGRRVLVLGGGRVAAGRVRLALEADAVVHLVAPQLCVELHARVRRGEVRWTQRSFEHGDLDGANMVMSCIDDHRQSAGFVRLCRERGIPVNAADIPEQCDFFFPAVHRDGPVQIAVSTNGQGPALAGRLRDRIAAALPRQLGAATRSFGALRRRLRSADPAPDGDPRRMRWLRMLGRTWSWHRLATLGEPDADALIASYLRGDEPPEDGHSEGQPAAVQLVGAGPGDPRLLTVAAKDALQRADVVLADRLISPEILALVRGDLRIAQKLPGRSEQAQAELYSGMLEAALAGKRVVRLKCGDPFLLGRGGEEVAWLAQHNIATEVIPGITTAFAAPLRAGIPVTTRGLADRVLVMTGHGKGGSRPKMPSFADDLTLVLLMAVRRLPELTEQLQQQGWPADWPVAIVERATRPGERVVRGTLATIASRAAAEGVAAPAAVVIGRTASADCCAASAQPVAASAGDRRASESA